MTSARRLPLRIPPAYPSAVHEAGPILYWRFEEEAGGRVPNEAAADASGVLTGEVRLWGNQENKVALFPKTESASFVRSADLLAEFDHRNYSIELWLHAESLQWATAAALVSPEPLVVAAETEIPQHLVVVECSDRTHYVHVPGAFRFLHRWPVGITSGINAFTETTLLPNQWHHVVAVKSIDRISIYLDGRHSRTVAIEDDASGPTGAYRFVVGSLDETRNLRQFEGMLDEVAVYPRALTEEEIVRHFQLVQSVDRALRLARR